MTTLTDIVGYLCKKYPHKSELSKARVTKMVYLADWKSAKDTGSPVTSIKWVFNHYGPYVEDVTKAARDDGRFAVNSEWTPYGNRKETISLKSTEANFLVDAPTMKILDDVIEKTKSLNWDAFLKLVYSTYPVLVTDKHSTIDLQSIAARYKRENSAAA